MRSMLLRHEERVFGDGEMSSDKRVSGIIKIGWSISERDLGIDGIKRELTSEELRDLYDRIEDALTRALPRIVDVHIGGEEKPPVRVVFEVNGDDEIAIDTGLVYWTLAMMRREIDG